MVPAHIPFRLHHVGFLVKDIPASAALFSSRLGYQVESDVIEDPVQTAVVQFLRLPGGASWLELVAPNGPGSKLAGALRKGGGLNHVCYEVSDLDDACAQLRETGMLSVGAPAAAAAFGGRRIAWLMDSAGLLVELVAAGNGPLSLSTLEGKGLQ